MPVDMGIYTLVMVQSQWGDHHLVGDARVMLSHHAGELYDDDRLMPMLRQLVRSTCQIAGAVGGSVSLIDVEAGHYTKIAEVGTACRLGQSFPLDQGVTGKVLEARAPVVLATYHGVPGAHLKAGHPAWDGAVAAIPIWWRAEIVAVNVIFVGAERAFTTSEVDGLELVTQVVAPGLVNAVRRELPETHLSRPGAQVVAPAAAPVPQSTVQDVVAGLLDLAQRSASVSVDDVTGLQVRVLRDGPEPRLLMRSQDLAGPHGEPSRATGWRELLDSGIDQEVMAVSGSEHLSPAQTSHPSPFTPREWGVLALLFRGLGDRAIATTLGVSPKTVEKHVSAVLRKTTTTSRTAAVVHCINHGWVP